MIGYKAVGAEVYQNGANGTAITWYHKTVKPTQLFGRVNGVPFIADPYINSKDFVPMFIRKKCVNKDGSESTKWVFEHPIEIVDAIKKAFVEHKIQLYSWKAHVDWLIASKMLEESEAEKRVKHIEKCEMHSAYTNREAAERKPSKHIRKFLKWQ